MTRIDDWADYLDPEVEDPSLSPADAEVLDRVNATLGRADVWDGPSVGLRERLFAQVAAERSAAGTTTAVGPDRSASVGEAAPVGVPGAEPVVRPSAEADAVARPAVDFAAARAARSRRRRWAAAITAVAAAAVVLAGVVFWPRGDSLPTYPMVGTTLASAATAQAEVEVRSAGVAITLHIKGLPPAKDGTYYAAWVQGPRGVVPVGSFHWRVGGIPILLWSGVGTAEYPDLFVTVQREGDPPEPSDLVVLRGNLNG
jgi:hypothetical protein